MTATTMSVDISIWRNSDKNSKMSFMVFYLTINIKCNDNTRPVQNQGKLLHSLIEDMGFFFARH